MKTLERARSDLEKAIKKRDQSRKRLEADEFTVKECEAALMESENNEYVLEIREWGLTVEELKELRKAMEHKSLAQVMKEKGEQERHDEFIEG
ncbi:MAG: DUF4315 family protein [Eubacteriales bacterium]|nr:DUF4315 family protein [Eubacteriales bacterium]